MTNTNDDASLFKKIHQSAGAEFLKRTHRRSFSRNIFQMNAVALIEAVQKVKDPNQGMVLLLEENREAGLQAHRELNRHIHNFVSSALALVEHTRVFMREHYVNSEVFEKYERKIAATFVQSPVAQFVQGLRNYMVHKGLPNSNMYMKFTPFPGGTGAGSMETGVQYETASLLSWDRWTSAAITYLEQAGGQLDIHDFAHEYMMLVNQFHEWLDETLTEHHRSDLEEMSRLQAQTEDTSQLPTLSTAQSDLECNIPFHLTEAQKTKLNGVSLEIFDKIRKINIKSAAPGFASERPTTLITEDDVIGEIKHWCEEENGGKAYSFFNIGGTSYGLGETDFQRLDELADVALEAAWARNSLSRKFVEATFFDWARKQFPSRPSPFTDELIEIAQRSLTNIQVCLPIEHMEVETGFDFGPVRISPVTAEYMTQLERTADQIAPEHKAKTNELFGKLRKEIQGTAAVFVSLKAEQDFAVERALRIAQDAVGLLIFFAPASPRSASFNPVGLIGSGCIPSMKMILTYDGGLTLNEGILVKSIAGWRMSASEISTLQSGLLDAVASLVETQGLSEFKLAIRASILNYTKGTTLVSPLDRLRNCVSSLEGVLLKHDMEPRSHSVAKRMSLLLNGKESDSPSVKTTVQQIYWLLEQPSPTEYGRRESELIALFTMFAYDILRTVLNNASRFSLKSDFLERVDALERSRQ